jgi:Tol biopolymer transport system component
MLLDVATGQEREVISRRSPILFPAVSPKGDRIAFSQPVARGAALYVVSADGSDFRQVTHGDSEQHVNPQLSSDGSWLYFYQLSPSKSFRRISVEGGTSTEVAPWDYLRERDARVDPRGRAVAYTTSKDGPPTATLVRDLESGKEHALAQVINGPAWSPDSQTIFGWYVSPDPGGDIWNRWNVAACPADGRPCRTLARGFGPIPTADGSRVFYNRDTGAERGTREVWVMSVDGTNPRKVGTIGPLPTAWSYDVSSSDQIVFPRLNASRRELWVAKLRK